MARIASGGEFATERDGRREMSKLKFSQVIRTLPAARSVWIECHLLNLNEWAARRYKGGGRKRRIIMQTLSQKERTGYRMGERPTLVEERASASQIESSHPGTHYFLVPLVQIFVRGWVIPDKNQTRYHCPPSLRKWISIITQEIDQYIIEIL